MISQSKQDVAPSSRRKIIVSSMAQRLWTLLAVSGCMYATLISLSTIVPAKEEAILIVAGIIALLESIASALICWLRVGGPGFRMLTAVLGVMCLGPALLIGLRLMR